MTDFKLIIPACFLMIANSLFAQNDPKWDDTKSKDWPDECKKVEIVSSFDEKIQPAYFFKSQSDTARPLVISLHTWSGGYDQKDTLSWQCIERDYNYIHPHFRGPNNNFEACGSPQVIQDIEDAISYAIKNGNVDTNEIHVTGTSGGGYATMLTYMKTKHPIKTFSSWVGISDLTKWYNESKSRGNKYALDIAKSTVKQNEFTKEFHYLGKEEAIKRSPYYMQTPVNARKNSKLFIYAGVHDGYTGSVPITHSLLFYNKVVNEMDSLETDALISKDGIIEPLSSRSFGEGQNEMLGDRKIHYKKSYADKLKIIIFEGGHEMLKTEALKHID